MTERESLRGVSFQMYWLRNDETGEVYPLGRMYGGTVDYTRRKLDSENLPYRWTLLAPIAVSE